MSASSVPETEISQQELPYEEPKPVKKPAPEFESWGRYPKLPAKVTPLYWTTDFPLAKKPFTQMLPVGMGRSYGDSCLLEDGTLLAARGLDRLLNFNPDTGLLRCEAGVTLAEILTFAVPRGWFLPVTPGTKYVTIAGAIANDIHGKNHHLAGTFGSHVPRFELVRSTGERFECSPRDNPAWYKATIGGLGLTGLITWAELQLRPIVSRKIKYEGIKFVGIDEFVALSQASLNVEYTVSWIDCVATGRNFCRGIFMQGDHSEVPDDLKPSPEPKLSLPIDLPDFMLNHYTVGAFNTAYYNKQLGKQKLALMDYEPFFYPLDKVLHWNRGYGKHGLLQFQCVLPWEPEHQYGIIEIMKAITQSGLASFLAVIKVFGDVGSPGMMSFPAPGITLALDFPVRADVSFDLCDRLAAITAEHGGRMYPAKDARMSAAHFQQFYPQWQDFARYVDPRLQFLLLAACHHKGQRFVTRPLKQTPQKILVLGATSSIAIAVMRELALPSSHLFLVGRNKTKLVATAQDLATRGAGQVDICVLDLDDTKAHTQMLASAAERLGSIDMALLAHGVLGDQDHAQASYPNAEAILGTNFLSPVSLITWLANYFEAKGSGVLAVISSVAGDRGRKSNYVYGSSKAALNVFLDGVRNRVDRHGVHVLTIKPGFVATPMTAHIPKNKLFATPPQVAKGILRAVDKRKDILYVPFFWWPIMTIIKLIPERIYKGLSIGE